jgi:NDP-sugar pyrophosphorylase family protein
VTIGGGNITVVNGDGAAIGGGHAYSSGNSTVGTVTITGGTLNVASSFGSGQAYIGSSATLSDLVILGGTISASDKFVTRFKCHAPKTVSLHI